MHNGRRRQEEKRHISFIFGLCMKNVQRRKRRLTNKSQYLLGFIQLFWFAFDRCADDAAQTHTLFSNPMAVSIVFLAGLLESKGRARQATVMHRYSKQTCITFCT